MATDPLVDKLLEVRMVARRVGVDERAAVECAERVADDRHEDLLLVAEALIEELLAGVDLGAAASSLLAAATAPAPG